MENKKKWLSEIEDMISSTQENLQLHYEFIKITGLMLEKEGYNVDQVILLNDVIKSDEPALHMVYMSVYKDANTIHFAFPYDNTSPQRFSINIIEVNSVTIENFMGISIYKDVFNDTNIYFDKILVGIINNLFNLLEDNGIF